ncbi:MAG: RagB/SusD family nutrient uptake outer membrane protein [Flavobacteriales bacterium]
MKKIFIYIAVTAVICSCKKDVLELDPISEIGSSEFYSNTQEVELATLAIYDGLQAVPLREFALTEMRSDNTKTKSSEGDWAQFEQFTVQPTNQVVASYWAANYNVIFRCNRVLENLDAVTNSSLRAQFEGEAKFSRALSHFNLVRAYGDIPLVDRVLGITDTEYFDRDPAAAVLDFITQDLVDASSLLPGRTAMDFGRATSGAAQALLAKVYLTTGNYSGAETLCASLIGGTEYELEADYSDVFYSEGNNEIIFAIPYLNDNLLESQDFSFEMTLGGVVSGLNYLTDDFKSNMDPSDSIRQEVLQNPLNQNEVGKYLTTSLNARLCGNDWIVLRLADVYLMHTEAIMAGMEATQNLEAISSYNAVRERVSLTLIELDGNGEVTLDMLLKERRYELAFENHRMYDLIRTGQALSVLDAFATSEGYIFTSTDLLLPLPLAEINVSNGQLVQNPGYF